MPKWGVGIGEQDYHEMYLNDVLPRIYEAVVQWRVRGGVNLSSSDQKIIMWLVKTKLMMRGQ